MFTPALKSMVVHFFFLLVIYSNVYAVDYIRQEDERRCKTFAVRRSMNEAMPFTRRITNQLTDSSKINYNRSATLDERKAICKAMAGSVIIHGSSASAFYKVTSSSSNPRYQGHLRALQRINNLAQRLWQGVQNGNYFTNVDQICDGSGKRTWLTINLVKWFYEALKSLKPELNIFGKALQNNSPDFGQEMTFMKKQQGFQDFYLAAHLPTTTLWQPGKQHYFFKGKYYTQQATVVDCEEDEAREWKDEKPKSWGSKADADLEDWVNFTHGGGLVYMLHFLEGRSAGYPLYGSPEGRRGIQVNPLVDEVGDRESATHYAKIALDWFFDYPAILTGRIKRKYLDEQYESYEAGIRGEYYGKIRVLNLQLMPLTSQEKKNFKYKIPDLVSFFGDLKNKRIKLKNPSLVARVSQLLKEIQDLLSLDNA